jgi:hypothetical protein
LETNFHRGGWKRLPLVTLVCVDPVLIRLAELRKSKDPEDMKRAQALTTLLSQPARVDYVVLLSLLPLPQGPAPEQLSSKAGDKLPDLSSQFGSIGSHFGFELANT